MVKYKNITIKKKGGGTRKQRVKVLASGKYKFVKNLHKRVKSRVKRRKTTRRKNNPKRRRRNLARRKKRRGGGKSLQRSIFKLARAGALLAPAAFVVVGGGTAKDKVSEISRRYCGVNLKTGQFSTDKLAEGWGPFIVTSAVTYLIPKINGIIRKI